MACGGGVLLECDSSHLELGELDDLVGGEVDLDGVVGLDEGVGEADGPAVVGHHVGDSLIPSGESLDAAELVGSLLGLNTHTQSESSGDAQGPRRNLGFSLAEADFPTPTTRPSNLLHVDVVPSSTSPHLPPSRKACPPAASQMRPSPAFVSFSSRCLYPALRVGHGTGSHSDAVEDEAAFGVVEEAEVLVGLVDRDHILEAAGVAHVGADPASEPAGQGVRGDA